MPYTIDSKAVRKQMFWNISRPQEVVKFDGEIPETWQGTPGQGLPVREIPTYEFPLVVYLWPNQPTRTVLHRNDRHEVVHEEQIPLEHLTRVICCDAHKDGGPKDCPACSQLLEVALAEGWQRDPYIPEPPADDTLAYWRQKK